MPRARRSAPVRRACSLQSAGKNSVRNSHSSSSRLRFFTHRVYQFPSPRAILKLAPMPPAPPRRGAISVCQFPSWEGSGVGWSAPGSWREPPPLIEGALLPRTHPVPNGEIARLQTLKLSDYTVTNVFAEFETRANTWPGDFAGFVVGPI